MAARPCSAVPHRFPGKAASIYWAWTYPSGLRVAHRTDTCFEHTQALLADWQDKNLLQEEENDFSTCINCGTSLSNEQPAAIFATVFLPRQERVDYEFWFCGACVEAERARIGSIGRRLADRDGSFATPSALPDLPWATLIPKRA